MSGDGWRWLSHYLFSLPVRSGWRHCCRAHSPWVPHRPLPLHHRGQGRFETSLPPVGISVQPEGAAAAATFNIGPAFERYQADPSQESAILDKIASDAKQVSAAIPVFEVNSITDYESAKSHLVMQVVPVEPNKEMLENIPHKTVEDIAVVYDSG